MKGTPSRRFIRRPPPPTVLVDSAKAQLVAVDARLWDAGGVTVVLLGVAAGVALLILGRTAGLVCVLLATILAVFWVFLRGSIERRLTKSAEGIELGFWIGRWRLRRTLFSGEFERRVEEDVRDDDSGWYDLWLATPQARWRLASQPAFGTDGVEVLQDAARQILAWQPGRQGTEPDGQTG